MKGKTLGAIIVIIALVAAVLILWYVVPGIGDGDTEREPADTAAVPSPDNTVVHGIYDTAAGDLWYFDEGRVERYEAFAALRPELDFSDIVWMVNVNLDKTPYEYINEAADPTSITLLVNKYFYLAPDFTPGDLVNIGSTMLREEAAMAMNVMIDAAAQEGHRLWVQSGYRSFNVQAGLFEQYSAYDGVEKAETYSARPGHSEHQTGLAADLNTITDAFGDTSEGKWAAENCWKYGFIVRYTEDNTDITLYKPEPWHMRYIGMEAAAGMRDLGIKSFEEYWAKYID